MPDMFALEYCPNVAVPFMLAGAWTVDQRSSRWKRSPLRSSRHHGP